MRHPLRTAFAAVIAALAAACSSPATPETIRVLDSPTDLTFVCLGQQQRDGGSEAVALPLSACNPALVPTAPGAVDAGPLDGSPPDAGVDAAPTGDGGYEPPYAFPTPYALIIETTRGDMMLAQATANINDLRDQDPLTPGINGLTVGELPIGITTTADGCWAVTANQGSCDLTAIHVRNVVQIRDESLHHVDVTSTAGGLGARPSAIVALPPDPLPTALVSCSDTPSGFVYVAYPSCNLVARIDLATGAIVDGVKWVPGSPPQIVGPDVTCPSECDAFAPLPPDAGMPITPPSEPVALAMDPDGTALYVGAWNAPEVARIELDVDGAPTVAEVALLEGTEGVTRLAATGLIEMGDDGVAGDYSFVYAIGRDGTIHVVQVTPGRAPHECDTQVDRRYLRDEANVALLACFPVGSVSTPPRRANARGPGIRMPLDTVPLDIEFKKVSTMRAQIPMPVQLNGTFAFVTALHPRATPPRGVGFYINVNDENYRDIEAPDDPRAVDMQLAVPHTLRDALTDRHLYPTGCVELSSRPDMRPPRIAEEIETQDGLFYNFNAAEVIQRVEDGQGNVISESHFVPSYAPMIHRLLCDDHTIVQGTVVEELRTVWELQTAHPSSLPRVVPDGPDPDNDDDIVYDPNPNDAVFAELRDTLFADLGNISSEVWHVEWQGPLSIVTLETRRFGGDFVPAGDTMTMFEPGGILCELGAQPGDIVELLGCTLDIDCGTGEVCVIHPQAPPGLTGLCVDPGRREALLSRCEELFTADRRYTVTDVHADKVGLVPRPRVLDSSPVDGCVSAAQCQAIHEYEVAQAEAAAGMGTVLPRYEFTCDADAAMGGPPRCIMTCSSDDECEPRSVCDEPTGQCVLGTIPDAECVATLQRYQVRAGDAFTVIGTTTGYLHRIVREPSTGECVADPSLSPLLVGRFGRHEPPCGDLGTEAIEPNPCRLVGLTEPTLLRTSIDRPATDVETEEWIERPTWAVRFRSLGLTIDFVDLAVPIPYDLPEISDADFFSPIRTGYSFDFEIQAGFETHKEDLLAHYPSRIRISPAGHIWVVDSGEGPIGNLGYFRGQIIALGLAADGPLRIF